MWVGYPNGLVPMTTEFDGGPVLGGTFPALIWHDFMISALHIDKTRAEQAAAAAAARATGKHGTVDDEHLRRSRRTVERHPPVPRSPVKKAPPNGTRARAQEQAPATVEVQANTAPAHHPRPPLLLPLPPQLRLGRAGLPISRKLARTEKWWRRRWRESRSHRRSQPPG